MKFSVIIPHYLTYDMTAYSVGQFLKYKDGHEVDIIVVDNSFPHDSIKSLDPFKDQIRVLEPPKDVLSSHGIAIDHAMMYVDSEWVIAAESDSFPTKAGWLNYFVDLIEQGYDGAGSVLDLSGGRYMHPCGMLFNFNSWHENYHVCKSCQYDYFPNMAMKHGFQSHLMVRRDILDEFYSEPEDFVELAPGYKPFSKELAEEKKRHYSSVVQPFHNGMGMNQESVTTYGLRNLETEVPAIILDNRAKLIYRVGYEPGQNFSYWQIAVGKKLYHVPTEVKWIEGRENRQQEYTLMENGFKHIWCGTSYLSMKGTDANDIYEFKKSQIESTIAGC